MSVTSPAPTVGTAPEVPVSVWPVAQTCHRDQRRGRYLPASLRHPARMLPALAHRAITTWTAPGDLVVDPLAGIGTTLVEAVHAGRDAIGADLEAAWVAAARRNLAHARAHGAAGTGLMLHTDARRAPAGLADFTRAAALMLLSPPYGPAVHGRVDPQPGRTIVRFHDSWTGRRGTRRPPTRAGHLAHPTAHRHLAGALAAVLDAWLPLLAPGGTVVVAARPWRRQGYLVDVPGAVLAAAEMVGLVPIERLVALLCGLRGQGLLARGSFFQLHNVRAARAAGRPDHLIAHEDLWVLRRPDHAAAGRDALRPPTPRPALLAPPDRDELDLLADGRAA